MTSQLLNPPKPPESRKTMKPRIELIGTTGYAIRIKETAVTHSDGHVTISRTPKVTGKGQRYFIARYCPKKKPND